VESSGEVTLLMLAGRLDDAAVASCWSKAVGAARTAQDGVRVDCAKVDSCGGAGFALLLIAGSHSTLAMGEFARFLDSEAVQGARNMATDTFFSRRRCVPVKRMLPTAMGATPVDCYSNTEEAKSSAWRAQLREQLLAQAARTFHGKPTRASAAAAAQLRGMASDKADTLVSKLERELAFLEPSKRASAWHLALPRPDAAGELCRAEVARWASERCWPWQVPDEQLSVEGAAALLARLRVTDERAVARAEALVARVRANPRLSDTERAAAEEAGARALFAPLVNRAAVRGEGRGHHGPRAVKKGARGVRGRRGGRHGGRAPRRPAAAAPHSHLHRKRRGRGR
jgi:hypothetical protein